MTAREAFDEFVDDYFAECDEHLGAMRRLLLALETRPSPTLDAGEVHELARRLHTLKGLSGMVGLVPAEELAHVLEDVLRACVAPRRAIQTETLDCLFTGVGLLDRIVQAKRTGHPSPAHDDFIARARDLLPAGRRTLASTAVVPAPSPAMTTDVGGERYRFEFTPSAEHSSRGVGVELVRQRLHRLGSIVRTTPRARPGGAVSFEFLVSLPTGVLPPAEWAADGLTWEREAAAVSPLDATVEPDAAAPANNMVRVELSRVDDLMRMIGEMVVLRARLDDSLRRANGSADLDDLRETNVAFERQLRSLREGVMRIRLVPVGEVFDRMRFAMRDAIRQSGKLVRLDFTGGDTQIDKLIVDRMLEPLLHLVRNAASHGIETRDEREARGKPPEGRIVLAARAAGDRIVLEVEDDGGGIDVDRVRARARDAGLLRVDRALTTEELLDVLCAPGFSTREVADRAAGRGVGMAVVRATIRGLGGELSLTTAPGQGTRFTIELPLTLMIADALLVQVGTQVMAVPQLALREIIELDESMVTALEQSEVISYRGSVLPLIRLRRVFNVDASENARPHVLVVGAETQQTGLVVDRLIGLREIVVHPVADPLLAVPGISAATELADGRISLIIDVAALTKRARDTNVRIRGGAPADRALARSVT